MITARPSGTCPPRSPKPGLPNTHRKAQPTSIRTDRPATDRIIWAHMLEDRLIATGVARIDADLALAQPREVQRPKGFFHPTAGPDLRKRFRALRLHVWAWGAL